MNERPRVDTPSPQPLNPQEEAAFRALARAMIVLPRALDADLSREQHLPLSEYLTLMHLSEAPDRRLRMSDLAADCDLSLSGMTRIVSRLERDDYVKRVVCEEDARGSNAVLTERGLERLQAAYPAHLASVRRQVVDHWQGLDLEQITQALHNIAR